MRVLGANGGNCLSAAQRGLGTLDKCSTAHLGSLVRRIRPNLSRQTWSQPLSNRVSGLATWKWKSREQRLARKMPRDAPNYARFRLQRLADMPRTRGNAAIIL